LAEFDDDQAIKALENAMSSSVEDIRLDVASALSLSKHRRALGLLLSMKVDSYYFVRLRVAQRLATANPAEAKPILYTLVNDENEEVREAARKSLAALAAPSG
jgi:HEAT repeat protein